MARRAPAFTLIELIVVIIIIAIMSSIVVPAYARFWERTRFNSAVSDVRDLFAYAREQAIANDTTVTVTYDPQSASLAAVVTPPPPLTDLPVVETNSNNPDASLEANTVPDPRILPVGEDAAIASFVTGGGSGSTLLHFQGDGTCEGAQIVLAGADGMGAQLLILPSTGRVTVDDGSNDGSGGSP